MPGGGKQTWLEDFLRVLNLSTKFSSLWPPCLSMLVGSVPNAESDSGDSPVCGERTLSTWQSEMHRRIEEFRVDESLVDSSSNPLVL